MRLASVLGVAIIAALPVCNAQGSIESRVTATIARMASKDLAIREAALSELGAEVSEGQKGGGISIPVLLARFFALHPQQADRVKMGLINLLQADNDDFMNPKATPGTLTENDTEHYALTIQIVSALHDERSVPALVGAITTDAAASGLVKYGRKALPPVLKELKNPDRLVQASAFLAAIEILRANSDPGMHADLLQLLTFGLTDRNDLIRQSALRGIEEKMPISDQRQLVSTLEQVARQDPFMITSPAGEPQYPNRVRAQRLLDAVKGR